MQLFRAVILAVLSCLVSPARSMGSDGDASIVPSWVYPGAPLRVFLASHDSEGDAPCRDRVRIHGRFIASGPDSLWLDDASSGPAGKWKVPEKFLKSEATRVLSHDELCRVDLRAGSHNQTGIGALVGLLGGVGLGLIATAAAGEAETDGVLPVWGLIVGPFVGAVVGRCISVEDWSPVWRAP